MKSISLILMLFAFLVSCVTVTKSEPLTAEGQMISRYHKDAKTEYEYHYGYNVMKGKMEYHYGPHTESEENIVSFTFLDDTLTYDNRTLYNRSRIVITYKRVYHDGVFHHNQIVNIK